MGIMNWLGVGAEIAKPIEAVSDLYTTDKARLAGEAEVAKQLAPSIAGQQAVNQELARSPSWFAHSWQPLIGWSAGFLLLLYYAPQIAVATWIWAHICINTGHLTPFPIKPDDIMQLVYLLFGFGGYHLINKKL